MITRFMRTRLQFGRWQEQGISVPWHLSVAGTPSNELNPNCLCSNSIVLKGFERAYKIYGARTPRIRARRGSTRLSSKTQPKIQGDKKTEAECQDEPNTTIPRKVDDSWEILDCVLADERVSKITDDFRGLDFSLSMIHDDGKAADTSSSRRLRPKPADRSWAVLAKALEKERTSQQQKNPSRKTHVKKKLSPGKLSKGGATFGGKFSRQVGRRTTRAKAFVSSEGKRPQIWKTKELKISILSSEEKDGQVLRKPSSSYEVVLPVTAYRELEDNSISPRIMPVYSPLISPFVSSILSSYLREKDGILKKNFHIATRLQSKKSEFRFRNGWKNEDYIPKFVYRCQRGLDSGVSSTLSSPQRVNAPISRITRGSLAELFVGKSEMAQNSISHRPPHPQGPNYRRIEIH